MMMYGIYGGEEANKQVHKKDTLYSSKLSTSATSSFTRTTASLGEDLTKGLGREYGCRCTNMAEDNHRPRDAPRRMMVKYCMWMYVSLWFTLEKGKRRKELRNENIQKQFKDSYGRRWSEGETCVDRR